MPMVVVHCRWHWYWKGLPGGHIANWVLFCVVSFVTLALVLVWFTRIFRATRLDATPAGSAPTAVLADKQQHLLLGSNPSSNTSSSNAPERARTDDGDCAATVVVTIQSATDEFLIALSADAKIIGLKSAISASKGYRAGYQQLFKDSEEPLANFVKFSDLFADEEERKLFLVLEQKSEGDSNLCVPTHTSLF
jgi:hypothetical protein